MTDTTGCRCAAGAADGNVYLDHVMKGCPSYESKAHRCESTPNLQELEARIVKIPHLMRNKKDWIDALNQAIDLLEHPNNLDALWVWSRFLNAFGKLDTWGADTCFDKLVYYERIRRQHEGRLQAVPWYRWLRRRTLAGNLARATSNVQTVIDYILDNDKNWHDRPAFDAHKSGVVEK